MKTKTKSKKKYRKKNGKKSKKSFPGKILLWLASAILRISLIIGIMAVLSGSFVFMYNYLYNSPYLKLKKIVVEGVNDATKNEVIKRSGLKGDLSIVAINLDEIRQSIEEHPWIRSVKIRRQFPDSIIIQVVKQQPVAIINAKKLYYINNHGEIFKQVEDSEFVDLPVLTGILDDGFSAEENIKLACQILEFLENQKRPLSLTKLSEIHFWGDGDVSLYFDQMPIEIKTEWAEIKNKINPLKKVLADLNKTGRIDKVAWIDLNYSNGIMVSFKDS